MPAEGIFPGFRESEGLTSLPDSLFTELLPQITDVGEIKVVLYALWRFGHMDGDMQSLGTEDFAASDLGLKSDEILAALVKAVSDGILLQEKVGSRVSYFVNSPTGRAAAEAMASGSPANKTHSSTPLERPDIFALYEANIGPLTPLIADALKDAEAGYAAEWIREAIELAVRNNKRSWSYCEAILRRWKEEGRGPKQNRRDDQAARQRDVEEKIRKFIRG